jgi:hypothetical protein
MKRFLSASTFCVALLFFASALPSHASIIITFSDTNLGNIGDVSTTGGVGSADPVVGLQANFDTVTISGAPSANGTYGPGGNAIPATFLTEDYCTTGGFPTCATGETPGIIYVFGPIAALNPNLNFSTSVANPLVTITLSAGLTANVTGNPTGSSINFPTDVSSIFVNSTFLSDLGLSATNFNLTGLVNALVQTAPNSFISTESLTLSSAVAPEPGSWLMMTLGLASMVFAARKKFSRTA